MCKLIIIAMCQQIGISTFTSSSIWKSSLSNGYHQRKWTKRLTVKFWIRLFVFLIVLISLVKFVLHSVVFLDGFIHFLYSGQLDSRSKTQSFVGKLSPIHAPLWSRCFSRSDCSYSPSYNKCSQFIYIPTWIRKGVGLNLRNVNPLPSELFRKG